MKLFFIFASLFSFSALAQAADDFKFQIYPLNPEVRFERSSDQDMVQRKPRNFALGLRKSSFSGLLESSVFDEDTGNATLGVNRSLQTYLAWGRLHYYRLENNTLDFSLYAGAAAGTYQETVTTTLNGFKTKDTGAQNLATGLSLGTDTAFHIYNSLSFVMAAEARLLFGQDLDPNPQVSLLARIGVQF